MALNADALVTLANAKVYLKISGTDEDSILELIINSVSTAIQSFLGRSLIDPGAEAPATEYYHGSGHEELILRGYPVVAITSIHEDSLRQWGASSAVNVSSDVMVDKASGILRCWNLKGFWTEGVANVRVKYRYGYAVASLPADIQLAAYRLVDRHFRDGYTHRRLDVASESIGERTSTYANLEIPNDVKKMISRYKRLLPSPHFAYAD